MVAEDKLSWEREKEERFGRTQSSKLQTIAETENGDDSDDEEEDKAAPAPPLSPLQPTKVVSVLPIPSSDSHPSDPTSPQLLDSVSPQQAIPSPQSLPVNPSHTVPPSDSNTLNEISSEPRPASAPSTAATATTATVGVGISHPHPNSRTPSTMTPTPTPVARVHHEGTLLKQSGFLGLWKHKYFVLDHDILKYYKHEKDKLDNNGLCKIFVLTSSTVLAYAKLSLVFKVVNEEAGEELCLMANSKEVLDEWIELLKGAISRKYSQMKRRSMNASTKKRGIEGGHS
jgi:hypothetical protein